jgi:phosphoglycolate phosphatase (TIGR01487 family)
MDIVEKIAEEILGRLGSAPCAIAADIDGTLTAERRRGSFRIDLAAVEAMRRFIDSGGVVILVTGNSAPVVTGLGRYLGAMGPHVAENGCLVYHHGRVWSTCSHTARPAARALEEELSWLLVPSWQNRCRWHDFAFLARSHDVDPAELVEEAERVLRARGLRAKLQSSGYALHVRPLDASKGRGIRFAASLAGLDTGCIIGVGDSGIDAEMREGVGLLAAVGNAEESLREAADIVLPGESGGSARLLFEAATRLRAAERPEG